MRIMAASPGLSLYLLLCLPAYAQATNPTCQVTITQYVDQKESWRGTDFAQNLRATEEAAGDMIKLRLAIHLLLWS